MWRKNNEICKRERPPSTRAAERAAAYPSANRRHALSPSITLCGRTRRASKDGAEVKAILPDFHWWRSLVFALLAAIFGALMWKFGSLEDTFSLNESVILTLALGAILRTFAKQES